jgi:hypothetical protein
MSRAGAKSAHRRMKCFQLLQRGNAATFNAVSSLEEGGRLVIRSPERSYCSGKRLLVFRIESTGDDHHTS